jgi:hypothetical protein
MIDNSFRPHWVARIGWCSVVLFGLGAVAFFFLSTSHAFHGVVWAYQAFVLLSLGFVLGTVVFAVGLALEWRRLAGALSSLEAETSQRPAASEKREAPQTGTPG